MPFVNLCEKSLSRNKKRKCCSAGHYAIHCRSQPQIYCTLWLTSPHTVSSCHVLTAVYCFLWLAGEWKTAILFQAGAITVCTSARRTTEIPTQVAPKNSSWRIQQTKPPHSVQYQVKNAWRFTSTSAYAYVEHCLRGTSLSDFRLIQPCNWNLLSPGILLSVD